MPPLLQLLCLIVAANGSPILIRLILRSELSRPIDGGVRFIDKRPLLGPSKTWAGLLTAIAVSGLLAAALGLSATLGLLIGVAAMTGDLLSSFIKRRLGILSSRPAPGLDQLPESLLPALLAAGPLGLSGQDILLTVTLFFAIEIALSHLLYRCGLRQYPY
jgi:CDP-2,3-bis-(O-geranylgeranyl)-sn-glycerol synthase